MLKLFHNCALHAQHLLPRHLQNDVSGLVDISHNEFVLKLTISLQFDFIFG